MKLWDLPEGWAWKTFGEVANVDSNLVDPADHSHLPHIAPYHIESGTGQLLPYKTVAEDGVTSSKHLFRPGHILYSKIRPYLAKAVMVDFAGLCSADMYPVSTSMEAEFLHRWLISSTFTAQASQSQGRTVLPKINKKALGVLKVPVPPREDQRRIVARIESLQARSRRAKEALDAIPPLLERFRQSVLAAAFRGDLTADWRKKNPDVEPASVLLERIRAERKRRWIDAETEKARSKAEAKAQKAGKPWTKAHDRKALEAGRKRAEKRYKEPEPVDPAGLPELPEGWCWASVNELAGRITSGSRDWKRYYNRGKGVFILAGNVKPGRLDLAKVQSVDPPLDHPDARRSQVEAGDLLVTIVGANTGDTCSVERPMPHHYVCQSVALVRPLLEVLTGWLLPYLVAGGGRRQFEKLMYGQGRPHLSFDDLRSCSVPLAPEPEMRQVVTRIGGHFASEDRLRASVNASAARLGQLDQSVLSAAFQGGLG